VSKKGKLIISPLPEPEELEPYSPWTWKDEWKDDALLMAFVVILILTAFVLSSLAGILCQ